MKEEVKIMRASSKDIPSLVKLRNELFIEENKYYPKELRAYKKPLKNKDKILEREFIKKIKSKNDVIFLAKIDDKIVGYIEGGVWKKNSFLEVKKIGDISNLIVNRKHRKKGISKKLYLKIEGWFKDKKCELQELYVLSENPAVKIYKKWGYKVTVLRMTKRVETPKKKFKK